MKSVVLILSAILLLNLQVLAQTTTAGSAIRGTVLDWGTRDVLPGVNIIAEGAKTGTTVDADGTFILKDLPAGTYDLTFTFIGFAKKRVEGLKVGQGETLDIGVIGMEEETINLSQVTVTPGSYSFMGQENLSRQTLTERDIKTMSWAEDITRVVARFPGISSSDYSSKFTIRGGEADEVLIAIDGMELYEPFHQRDYSGGLFSIVDIETIQGVELMTGGFSADHGNRLSGVFNMRTKSIADNQKHTSIGLSAMNARIYTDGKFADNKGSYIVSARRGMLDLIFKAVGSTENLPVFYDAMGKVEYQLSEKNTLSFHILQAGDRTRVRDISEEGDYDKNDTKYSNTYSWLTLKSFYNPSLFSRTILYTGLISHDRAGSFHKYEPGDKGDFQLTDKRDYSFIGLKQDWNWEVSKKLVFRTGFDGKLVKADYQYFMDLSDLRPDSDGVLYNFHRRTDLNANPSGQQLGTFLTGRYLLLPKLILEAGLRYDLATYSDDNIWSPRVSMAYAFGKNTFLRGAWGYYYQSQFINNLDINNGITTFNPAELAKHYVLGFEHLFPNGVNFRLEGYLKELSNLSPQWQNMRDHLEMFPEQRNDYAQVIFNSATSKGIELFLKYDRGGKISWWFSYALAKSEDDIKDIVFDGLLTKRTGKAPRLNDQRHTIFADLNFRPNEKWSYNFSWQYYIGWPRTDYTYRYQILPNGDYHFYPEHKVFNATIYPAYHRMDVRVNRKFQLKHSDLMVFLHLINVYNHKNLKKFDLDAKNDDGEYSIDEAGNYVPFHDDKYWLGFIPVLGASWEF